MVSLYICTSSKHWAPTQKAQALLDPSTITPTYLIGIFQLLLWSGNQQCFTSRHPVVVYYRIAFRPYRRRLRPATLQTDAAWRLIIAPQRWLLASGAWRRNHWQSCDNRRLRNENELKCQDTAVVHVNVLENEWMNIVALRHSSSVTGSCASDRLKPCGLCSH